MGGRASIILVMGFAFVLGYVSMNLNKFATEAVGNMTGYFENSASHNLALAGANVGLAKFYQDTTWHSAITQSFSTGSLRGSFTAQVSNLSASQAMLRSVSTYPSSAWGDLHDTVEVYFNRTRLNSFSMFAWMTNFEGNVFWIDQDTVWGRVHSNRALHVNGKPVFMEKATTVKQFDPKPGVGTNKAIFKQGYETGVATIDFPTDLSEITTASTSGGKRYTGPIWVTLSPGTAANGDGKAFIRSTKTGPIIDSISMSDPTFNGVILGEQDVNIQGTLDGALTVSSLKNVWIQDDVLYENNPLAGSSNDILGLVANQNVIVADNVPNKTNCVVQAAVFARSGSFLAENYNTRGVCGTLQLVGSIVQDTRGAVGTFSGSTLNSGFSKRYRFDTRLQDPSFRPPYFPGYYVKTYAITNWWESYRVPRPS
jgi:hypothetical protein